MPAMCATKHPTLLEWVARVVDLTRPDQVVWINGSEEQHHELTDMLVASGTLRHLGGRFEGSHLACSDPRDVARVVRNTHICSERDSGHLTNWWNPREAYPAMLNRFASCMRGRTMYVVPMCMGPLGSLLSEIVIQVTDSPYVVLNNLIMARCGDGVLRQLGRSGEFVRALHSVGVPLMAGQKDMPWPCNPEELKVCHFPERNTVMSYGSGYGGNALLGKKCVALRLAGARAAQDPTGAMAEHMMLVRVRNTRTGRMWHVAAAFPSACGKTNLAMLQPTIPDWEITTLGDDICWIRRGEDGRLYAINPEAGFFGVAPGTGPDTNPVALGAILKGSLLTNVAYDSDTSEAWWPGLADPPERLITWKGELWTKTSGIDPKTTVHPNARFTTPYRHCDMADVEAWDDPRGVPLDLILFGGRRPDTVPLVRLARDWKEGVAFGLMVSSLTTAAAEGRVDELAHDPFAMAPFLGLSLADEVANWLRIGETADQNRLPAVGYVNWFRRGEDGHFLWPGFSHNGRVLDVVLRYLEGEAAWVETPIGLLPTPEHFNLVGTSVSHGDMGELTKVDPAAWQKEIERTQAYLEAFEGLSPEVLKRLEQTHAALST